MLRLSAGLAAAGVLFVVPCAQVSAQSPSETVIRAVPLSSPIRVDGRLDDAAWADAPMYTEFIQRDPDDGEPASQRTEVRIMYGFGAVYVGARMYDSDPRRIRARLARRDEPIFNADVLEVFLDPHNDGVSGYVFRITPAGALRDAAIDANLSQDNSWDAVWEGVATMDSLGWAAEMRIPFSQLRYNSGPADTIWGIQLSRVIGWRGETSFLPARPKAVASSPAHWGKLVGLHDLPRNRQAELTPYVSTRAQNVARQPGNPLGRDNGFRHAAGADLRYRLTNTLTLSGTVNPDFGQVEVDPSRINLTASELFFPERRPFFVERADMFRFGQVRVGTAGGFPSPTISPGMASLLTGTGFEAFHSRRIGRKPQRSVASAYPYVEEPDEVTIAGALKLTGRTAGGLSIGVLDAVTLEERARVATSAGENSSEPVEPATNYFVGRARQELRGGNTMVGALLTSVNRRLDDPGLAALLRRNAYFTGLDFQHSWRQREWSLDGAWGTSLVTGSEDAIAETQRSPVRYLQRPDRRTHRFDPTLSSLTGTGWHAGIAKNAGRHWLGSVFYRGISPGLEVNDVGFSTLAGFRNLSWSIAYREDVPGRWFRAYHIRPYGLQSRNWDGFRGHRATGVVTEVTLRNFWQIYTRGEHTNGRLNSFITRGGPLMGRPDSRLREITLISDRRNTWLASVAVFHERDDIGSWNDSFLASLDWRPRSELRLNAGPGFSTRRIATQYVTQFEDGDAAETFGRRYVFGSLRYHELALVMRADWTFSPTLSLQIFAQPLVASGRYSHLQSLRRPGTLEFDVLSESEGTLQRDGGELVLYPAGAAFRIRDPDFDSRTLVGNAVVRWEYRPGSALFFVWQQRRSGDALTGEFSPGRDFRRVFSERPENVFAIKGTYWLQL